MCIWRNHKMVCAVFLSNNSSGLCTTRDLPVCSYFLDALSCKFVRRKLMCWLTGISSWIHALRLPLIFNRWLALWHVIQGHIILRLLYEIYQKLDTKCVRIALDRYGFTVLNITTYCTSKYRYLAMRKLEFIMTQLLSIIYIMAGHAIVVVKDIIDGK